MKEADRVALALTPSVLGAARAMIHLGALYAMERMKCSNPSCPDNCADALLQMYETITALGQADDAPFYFSWGNNTLQVAVRDAVDLATNYPAIGETITRLERLGFVVQHPQLN